MKLPPAFSQFVGIHAAFLALAGSASASSIVPTANFGTITINDNGIALPYPSTIAVSGISGNVVTKVTVQLTGFSHTYPDDVDIILVGPQGQRVIIMSDAGGGNPGVSGVTLTFDQGSANVLPDSTAPASGTYRPANYANEGGVTLDTFPSPGPGALDSAPADLGVFNGTNPNGTWSLYVVDDATGDAGQITNGWFLTLTVPQVFTVTNTNDIGAGSLRAALTSAGDGDLINFDPSVFSTPQTINLQTALADITKSVTIQGPGANFLTVRRDDVTALTDFRVFNIPGGVASGVAISGMTIADGRATAAGNGSFGGGIFSRSALTLTNVHLTGNRAAAGGGGVSLGITDGVFTGCTFSNNTAGIHGGGIFYQGDGHTLRVVSSTISGNVTISADGGIYVTSVGGDSRLEVTSSTIAQNVGGIRNDNQGAASTTTTTTLRNTIIAGNILTNLTALSSGSGAVAIQTLGFNLSDNFNGVFAPAGTDITTATPRLGPLSLNGGTTPTHALLGGSPAIDAGNRSGVTTDQRGQVRPFDLPGVVNPSGGDGSDIGAVEMRPILNVTNTNDSGVGSLRQAISDANSSSDLTDVLFDSTLFSTPQTIKLLSALPNISQSATINGPGANLLTVRRDPNAATDFRIFNIPFSGLNVAFSGMTIAGGTGPSSFGGGILCDSDLTLTNVHVTGNQAATGGGVGLGFGNGVFTGCTFSGNTATTNGGGIVYQGNDGHILRLVSSTVSGNSAPGNGAGIETLSTSGLTRLDVVNSTIANNTGGGSFTFNQGAGNTATTTFRNTIIAGNTPNNLATGTNGGGAAINQSFGFNLSNDYSGSGFTPLLVDITADPRLAPLALYGGPTPTHALLGGSPAIDAGDSSGATTDQRGRTRPFDTPNVATAAGGDGADIGAVEMHTVFVTNVQTSGAGSLPSVVANAPADSDILFFASVFNSPRTITLTTGELVINKNLTIVGPGANLLTVSGNNSSRIFSNLGFSVSLEGMTLTGGNGAGAANNGAGGAIQSVGDLALTNLYLTGNQASTGGGLYLGFANGVVTGCTFSSNQANGDGGGVEFEGDGGHALRLVSSTLSGNHASSNGGGILNISFNGNSQLDVVNSTVANNTGSGINTYAANSSNTATTTLRNTLLAGNSPSNLITGGSGTPKVTTFGFNLTSDNGGGFLNVAPINSDRANANAALAPLAFNGGTTPTHALLAGSDALDAGHDSGFLTDQRGLGFTRTIDLPQITNATRSDGTDIGAVEALIDPALRITSITRQTNGQVVLTGVGTLFATYTIERSTTTPDSASFSTLTTVAADESGVIHYTDSSATTLTRAFYRLR